MFNPRQKTLIGVDIVGDRSFTIERDTSCSECYYSTTSYKEGCNLNYMLNQIYSTEGVFQPKFTVYNGNYSKTTFVERPIRVLRRISQPLIKSKPSALVGEDLSFSLVFKTVSINMTASWIVRNLLSVQVANKTTSITYGNGLDFSALDTSFQFGHAGVYTVTCNVSNMISQKEVMTHVFVEEPIQALKLTCNKGQTIELHEYVTCTASCSFGSQIRFYWNFQKATSRTINRYENVVDQHGDNELKDSKDNHFNNKHTNVKSSHNSKANGKQFTFGSSLSSTISRRFHGPGIYFVSVVANNSISREVESLPYSLVVEVGVGCVSVHANVSYALTSNGRKMVNILAVVNKGTNLKFDLDINQSGRLMASKQEIKTNRSSTILSSDLPFTSSGMYNVTVWVYNEVSSTSRSVNVNIHEFPPQFVIKAKKAPIASFRTLVVESISGKLLFI